jgi:hypothetical protein
MSPEPPMAPAPVPDESELMLDSEPEAPELPDSLVVLFLLSQEPSSAVLSTIAAANRDGFFVNIMLKD